MKRILFLLLLTVSVYGQNPSRFAKIQITGNSNSGTATKVNVQEADGVVNTIAKNDLIDVVEVNDVPTLPLVGEVGKIYVVKNVNKIYRWNGTFYQELAVTDISVKINLSEKGAINGVATLGSDGKVPNSQIPALAISETFHVSSQAQMLALSQADQGDVAIRSDISKSFILRQLPSSVLDNWNELLTPTSAVTSVNGQVGVVTLSKSDVGISNVDNTSDANKPVSNATQTALNLKENSFTKNTAFNKNFGTTAGTVVEGGTLGSNAYSSTPYLPLTGGTVNGSVYLNSTTGGLLSFQTNSLPLALMSSSRNIIGGASSTTDFNTYVYGNNPYNIWTNGVKRLEISGLGEFKINNLSGTGTRNVVADASGNLLTDSTVYAPLNGTGANGTWGINISGNSQTSSALGEYNWNPTVKDNADFIFGRNSANEIAIISQLGARNFLGLGSNAYSSTPYLPLTGGTINANNETINYKVSSNNGALYNSWYDFNNNRISFLGFGGGTQSNATFFVASENGGNIALNTTGVGKVVVSSLSGTGDGNIVADADGTIKRGTPLGSNAYSSTAYLPLSGGTLTGIVTAPTPTAGSVGTQIATKEYVLANSGVTSTGTTNRIPKFTSSNSLGDSGLIQVGGNIGMGSAVVPGELFHIGDGNILLEGGGEVAQKFKRDFTTTGENLGVPTGSGISVNPIFQVGRIIQAGDGDPEIRIMYSDDNTSERTVFEVDRKGIAASVKTSIGSHFEGFASLTDVNPKFRLNSYPRMRLEMGAGGNDITDVAVERGATGSLDFFTNSAYRGGFDSSGNLNLLNTPTAPTATVGTNTTQIATTAFVQANSSARPYKVYTALLTQGGTGAPTATVLENTLGGTVVWSRISEGVYVGTLANGFSLTLSKVRIFISGGEPHLNTTGFYNALPNNINSVQVNTKNTSGSLADSLMSAGATIEIRVYN